MGWYWKWGLWEVIREMGHEDRALGVRFRAPIRRDTKELASLSPSVSIQERPCEDKEDNHLQTKESALNRHQPCWHIYLGLSVTRTVRNKVLLLEPPHLWYFVMEAQAN